MLTPDVFRREVAKLSLSLDASPHKPEPSNERLQQLFEDVKHLDDDTFIVACDRCRKELVWFPKAAHILARARPLLQTSAEERAGRLLKKLSRYNPDIGVVNDGTRGLLVTGTEQPGGFDADERAVLEECGGVRALFERSEKGHDRDATTFVRQAFVAAFARRATRREAEDTLLALRPAPGLLGDGE